MARIELRAARLSVMITPSCAYPSALNDTHRNQNAKRRQIVRSVVVVERCRITLFVIVQWLTAPKNILSLLCRHDVEVAGLLSSGS